MTERYFLETDDEYCYIIDTESEYYKSLEDFEKQELENAKKDNIDVEEYKEAILELAYDKYWEWVYNYHITDGIDDILNDLDEKCNKLQEDLDYYETKCGELEIALMNEQRENKMLQTTIGRNEAYINRITEQSIWDNNSFNVNEERKTIKSTKSASPKNKIELDDIIGLVKTDEPTNSVELKKELYKK